jgi:cyclohexanone monooxygenase
LYPAALPAPAVYFSLDTIMPTTPSLRIAIIGAGPAGIAAGHELLKQGFENFSIYDEQDAPGGTWKLHSYPGLACDVWAHSYSFSYAPNPDWSANFVEQAEIQQYLSRSATEFGLDPHLRLNTRINSAHYRPEGGWTLQSAAGEQIECDVLINAMGNQYTPLYPDVEGMDSFAGDSWHGTRWNHTVDLSGKRVAVVGSAACAIQMVPEVAKQAAQLTVLQRSPNWVMPRNRKLYSDRQRRRFGRFPALIGLTRWLQRLMMGQVLPAVTHGHARMGQFEAMVKKYIERTIDDPAVREAVTPLDHYGCKRGLVSDDFYQTLNRAHVELVPDGLQRVTPSGLVTSGGREIDVDVIIYATGYRILDFDRIDVVGKEGQTLAAAMADNPRSHKGISLPGFPNYFFAVGPNGLVLNVSYFLSAERNIESIVSLVGAMQKQGAHTIEVKPEAFASYNNWMLERFSRYSWGSEDCNSYYRNASGHAPFLFPGSFKEYVALHEQSGLQEYNCS